MRRRTLRLEYLECRTAPAAFNTLISHTDPANYSDTPGGDSYVEYDPVSTTHFGANISADGRFTAINSAATNVIPGQVDSNTGFDIFLYDRMSNSTQLVSTATGSTVTAANGQSSAPVISADGRYVAFLSTATNLIPNFVAVPSAKTNVYLYDRNTGQCTLVSHRFNSVNTSGSYDCSVVSISANGGVVVYESYAVDLIAGFPNTGGGTSSTNIHSYAFDVGTGQVTLIDHKFGSLTTPGSGYGGAAGPSPDGRYIYLGSNSSDLLNTPSTSKGDAYRFDRQTGVNELISRASNTAPFGGNGVSSAFLCADPRWIVLETKATNLVPGATMSGNQLVLYDAITGTMSLITHSISNPLVGASGNSHFASMSSDGKYVAFTSVATDLVVGFTDGNSATREDVFLFDRTTGLTTLVSHQATSLTISGNDGGAINAISDDGHYLFYLSLATDLISGFVDGNGGTGAGVGTGIDLYRFDRLLGTTTLVTGKNGSATVSANGGSSLCSISSNGNVVAFSTAANDLMPSVIDLNAFNDIYVRDYSTGATTLASRRFGGPSLSPGGESDYVQQSADGRYIVFTDSATNLVPGQLDTPNTLDVFLYDRVTKVTALVDHAFDSVAKAATGIVQPYSGGTYYNNSFVPVISADGRYVAYTSNATNLVANFVDANGPYTTGVGPGTDIYLFDRVTGTNTLVSHQAGSANISGNNYSGYHRSSVDYDLTISDDGRYVSYVSLATDLVSGFVNNNGSSPGGVTTGFDLFVFDRLSGTSKLLSHTPGQPLTGADKGSLGPKISGDGRYIAFWSNASTLVPGAAGRNVYLYDQQTDASSLISHIAGSPTLGGNGGSNAPVISRDGSYVVFQSAANNLINGIDSNNANDVFIYDRSSGLNMLVSHTVGSSVTAGSLPSELDSRDVMVSDDGRFVAFLSQAQDLVSGFVDGNGQDTFSGGGYPGDIYLFDRLSGANTLLSHTPAAPNKGGNQQSFSPGISGEGRFVTFISGAGDLVPLMNGVQSSLPQQAYVYDRVLGKLSLISHGSAGEDVPGTFGVAPYGPKVNHDGSSVVYYSLSDNLVVGDFNQFTDIFAYVTPPPQVASIQINDGSPQRSIIRSITVNFDEPVFFNGDPASAFTLTRNGSVGSVQLALSSINNNPNGSITLTFSGALTQFGSLMDGKYTLTIDASKVSNIVALDGNGDGVAGDNWISADYQIYRLFGDANGDHHVDAIDFNAFMQAFNTNSITFDFDNNGLSDGLEFGRFRQNFGAMI